MSPIERIAMQAAHRPIPTKARLREEINQAKEQNQVLMKLVSNMAKLLEFTRQHDTAWRRGLAAAPDTLGTKAHDLAEYDFLQAEVSKLFGKERGHAEPEVAAPSPYFTEEHSDHFVFKSTDANNG
jgi:hypothetical protein